MYVKSAHTVVLRRIPLTPTATHVTLHATTADIPEAHHTTCNKLQQLRVQPQEQTHVVTVVELPLP